MGADSLIPLTDAQRQLVEDNTGLVWWWVNRKCQSSSEDERNETYCDAVFGLIRAAQKFDPTLGYQFSTYALFWIRQAAQRGRERRAGLNHARALIRGVEYQTPTSLDALVGDDLTLGDFQVSPDDVEAEALARLTIGSLADTPGLDRLDRAIVDGIVGGDLLNGSRLSADRALADRYGTTDATIRRRRLRLDARLREAIGA